jgi:cell division protein FtsI/penicillin-binding protein 2
MFTPISAMRPTAGTSLALASDPNNNNNNNNNNDNNSVALIHERTISTERQPLVGEVSANVLRMESATWPA